jgi:hypothetical protein
MASRIRVLCAVAAAALSFLTSCGVSQDEAIRIKDETSRQEIGNAYACSNVGCPYVDPNHPNDTVVCVELFFDFGRSPPLCMGLEHLCDKFECEKEGRVCAVFDGFPGQVKCKDP